MWFVGLDQTQDNKHKRAGTAGSFHWSCLFFLASIFFIYEFNTIAQTRDPQSLTILDQKEIELLAKDRQWLKLIHFEPSVFSPPSGQIDSPDFYLANTGKENAEDELREFIRRLTYEAQLGIQQASALPEESLIQCRFPARVRWLRKQRLNLPIQEIHCPRLEEFRMKRGGQSVSLVFSSYYVNNPSSSFGHTLLRINRRAETDGRRFELLDYGFNFAAQATSNNPLVYSVKGLFGGFDGVFSSLPYYFKVREYNQAEARDLWEYELNLSPDEVSMLVDHLWEVGPQKIDYWYLTENCAYFMLTLLEAGAPQWHLDRAMKTYVIPSDTIRLVAQQPGLVRRISFRPSIRREFLTRFQLLNDSQRRTTILGAKVLDDPSLAQTYSFGTDPMIFDALLDYIDMTYALEIQMDNTNAKHMRDQLLSQRSRLSSTPELKVPIPESERPDLGHSSRRAGIGLRNKTDHLSAKSTNYLDFNYRFAHHDLLDPITGYPRDASIQFFDFSGFLEQSQLHIDDWTMIGIQSLNPISTWEKNMSWEFKVGVEEDEFFRARLGGGYALRFDDLLLYGGVQLLAGTQVGISSGQTSTREAKLLTHTFVQYIINQNWRTLCDALAGHIKLGVQYDFSGPESGESTKKSIRFLVKKTNHDWQGSILSIFYL